MAVCACVAIVIGVAARYTEAGRDVRSERCACQLASALTFARIELSGAGWSDDAPLQAERSAAREAQALRAASDAETPGGIELAVERAQPLGDAGTIGQRIVRAHAL
jgi:hypothetical protein